jgi:hypothetical protein
MALVNRQWVKILNVIFQRAGFYNKFFNPALHYNIGVNMIIAVLYLPGWHVVLGAKAVSLSPKIELMSGIVTITGFSIRISYSVSNGISTSVRHSFPAKRKSNKKQQSIKSGKCLISTCKPANTNNTIQIIPKSIRPK